MLRPLLTIVLLLSLSVTSSMLQAGDSAVKWQHDLQTAHRISQSQNKPMMLVFCATWCGPCKKLTGQTMANPQMAAYINQHFVPIHLDADRDARIAEILRVESLPTTIILSPNADLIGRFSGYSDVKGYHQKLSQAYAVHQRIQQVALQPAR